jgi:hypothetical protein
MIRPVVTLLVTSTLLAASVPAFAQDARPLTVSAGITTFRQQPPGPFDAQTYDRGWAFAASYVVWKRLGGVFDMGANSRTNLVGEEQNLKYYLSGVRYDLVNARRLRAYGQVLFGRETFSEPGFTEDGFAIQPGGGVDVYVWRGLGVRAQVDYRSTDYDGARYSAWRVFLGGVAAFGW